MRDDVSCFRVSVYIWCATDNEKELEINGISFLQDMQTIPNFKCLFRSGRRANHSTETALIRVFIV